MGPGPGGFRNSREKMIEKLKEPKPEKFSEILTVNPAFRHVHHGCKTVQFRIDLILHVPHGFDHIRQLSDAGRLDQYPVRMVLFHDLF